MKYGITIVGIIVVALIAIILIISRGPSTTTEVTGPISMLSYQYKNAEITHTTFGQLVGQDQRRGIRITITSSERRLDILSGYEESILVSQSFPNTQDAYTEFLFAMQNLRFTHEREAVPSDLRGVCPTGRQYVYAIRNSGNTDLSTWSTSCSAKQGTFNGTSALRVRQLFQMQIPDYRKLVSDVRLAP